MDIPDCFSSKNKELDEDTWGVPEEMLYWGRKVLSGQIGRKAKDSMAPAASRLGASQTIWIACLFAHTLSLGCFPLPFIWAFWSHPHITLLLYYHLWLLHWLATMLILKHLCSLQCGVTAECCCRCPVLHYIYTAVSWCAHWVILPGLLNT